MSPLENNQRITDFLASIEDLKTRIYNEVESHRLHQNDTEMDFGIDENQIQAE